MDNYTIIKHPIIGCVNKIHQHDNHEIKSCSSGPDGQGLLIALHFSHSKEKDN